MRPVCPLLCLPFVLASRAANPSAGVRAEFLHSWNGYVRYAWGHDELRPISKTPRDCYDGQSLLITAVDTEAHPLRRTW